MSHEGMPERQWWKEAVVYEVYPRSFNDSDGDVRQTDGLTSQPESRQLSGDGVGDIPGITEKVDYLDSLGVDVIWLCPVYDSPNADNGYDIRDYRSIASEFGDMEDWETLLSELHARDMRLVMDLVVNHTSDEHEWFQRSRRRDPEYEDYYYWRDGSPDEPPNNWESFMGGSAWTYDDSREQWYLHIFDEKQPDLNWRNPAVRDDIAEMVTWWLEKGIDGFRIDAISFISKPEGLPDGDPSLSPVGDDQFSHGPRIHEYLRELYDRTFSNYDVMTVAEMGGTTVEMAMDYLGESGAGLNMIFHFEHMGIDTGPGGRWDPTEWGEWDLVDLKRIMSRWQNGLHSEGWNSIYLGNHDQPRIVSRFGDDEEFRTESAKLLATFLLTTRGTAYIYQGDEIGMTNEDFATVDELDDPMTIGAIDELLATGAVESYEEIREFVNHTSRDHSRTPMQWSNDQYAGFTDGDPWFSVNENYHDINVESAIADESSIWHHYRSLIDLRHREEALVYGDYELLLPDDEQLYTYTRTLDDEKFLIVLNWSEESARFDTDVQTVNSEVVFSNYPDSPTVPSGEVFRPYEAVVYRCPRVTD